jgi:hypothetical protein
MYDTDDIEDIIAEFGLPDLPEPQDEPDEDAVELVLYRERLADENIPLGDGFAVADAMEYCDREDTHGTDRAGNGWFVGWRH